MNLTIENLLNYLRANVGDIADSFSSDEIEVSPEDIEDIINELHTRLIGDR